MLMSVHIDRSPYNTGAAVLLHCSWNRRAAASICRPDLPIKPPARPMVDATRHYAINTTQQPLPLTQTSVPASPSRTSLTSASLHFLTSSWVYRCITN